MRVNLTRRLTSQIRLDDDPQISAAPPQIPEIDLLRRNAVGHDGDGNRVFDWTVIASSMPVISYESRVVEQEDIRKLHVKLVALWDDHAVLDATDLAFAYRTVAGEDRVFQVTAYEQNGFRLSLHGQRLL